MMSAFVRRLIGKSLRQRLVLLFAVILLPPTVLSLYLAWDSFVEHKARAKLQVRQLAMLAATYESKFFDDARETLQRLAERIAVESQDGAPCQALLSEAAETAPEFAAVALFDPGGDPVCGSDHEAPSVADRDWFREVQRFRHFTISDYTFGPGSAYPVIFVAQAVRGSEGRLKGVLAATIELYWLSSFIRDAKLPLDSVFFLLDSNGNVLADRSLFLDSSSPGLPKNGAAGKLTASLDSVVQKDITAEIVKRRLVDFEAIGNDELRRVYSSVALPHGNVIALFGVPASSALGWLERDLIARVLSLAAIWLTAIGAAWFGTRLLVTRWTAALQQMAFAYGNADYSAKLDLTNAPSELSDLGNTLMLMASRIEGREDELKASLEQKNVLLKEIHHRVKNNLQIVLSLLNIRRKSARTSEDFSAIEEIRTRVNALALVHRHLYEGDDVRLVDFRSFMTDLCQNTLCGLKTSTHQITLHLELPEFMIASDKATPIALLVTEAMTNSVKYAFPNRQPGTISIRFRDNDDGTSTLIIADDGIGLADNDDSKGKVRGMGLNLVCAFARQLNGEVTFSGPPGSTIEIRLERAVLSGTRIHDIGESEAA